MKPFQISGEYAKKKRDHKVNVPPAGMIEKFSVFTSMMVWFPPM